jgi:rhamnosyltransferase
MKVAGVVVFFNPHFEVWHNILSYLDEIDFLFVVDNSEIYNSELIKILQCHKRIEYINNFKNLGVAYALNLGAHRAIEGGYQWLLMMDQDSRFPQGGVGQMVEFVKVYDNGYLGILSPRHNFGVENIVKNDEYCFCGKFRIKYRLVTMTSGNFLNLNIYSKVGPFEEKLFIDYIDHEYCLRLNSLGYKVIEVCDNVLYHKLGDIRRKNFFIRFYTTNHNYIRRYYITRNRLYVLGIYKNQFREFCQEDYKYQIKEWIKILLGESDKIQKITSIIRGIVDYKRDKFGKYDYE